MTPGRAPLQDFAKRYTAAWCSQNASSVAACFAPNGSLSVNGAPAVGRRAITEVAQGFMTAFPDMQLLMDDLLIQGDRAVYHWTLIGTYTGQAAPVIGFASAASRCGSSGRMASSPSRRATSMVPPTGVSWSAASRNPRRNAPSQVALSILLPLVSFFLFCFNS